MNNKKILRNFWYNHYEYEIISTYDDFVGMINIDIRKILYPNRKFFRTILVKTRYVSVDKFETLQEACSQCFNDYIREMEAYNTKQRKIEKLFENA